MNKLSVVKFAKKNMPSVDYFVASEILRHQIVGELNGSDNIGIELGVAQGVFSKRMISSGKFKEFWGVDSYGDSHNTEEYIEALKYIGIENRYRLLRMNFDEALEVFEDEYFDFIYIDGFAHTGEEGGKALIDWFRKLKVGGILAGDDYHEDWPLVQWAVNDFSEKVGVKFSITGGKEENDWCKYPSWFLRKEKNVDVFLDPCLYRIAMKEKKRIHRKRSGIYSKIKRNILRVPGARSLISFVKVYFK